MTTRIVQNAEDSTYTHMVGAFAHLLHKLPWIQLESLAKKIETKRSKGKKECRKMVTAQMVFEALCEQKKNL